MQIVGKTTIHPVWFYSGKTAGYLTWIALFLSISQIVDFRQVHSRVLEYLSYATLLAGLIISTLSIVNLGRSTTLGIPTTKTMLKQTGLYRISRNPMYVGFNLLTISSIVFHLNIVILICGIYSIFVYHLIVLGEESFLEKEFSQGYLAYKSRVRRYL